MTSLEYIRHTYKVPAKRGMRVTVDGLPGRITSFKHGYIRVLFDGNKNALSCHPTWRATYHTATGDQHFGRGK